MKKFYLFDVQVWAYIAFLWLSLVGPIPLQAEKNPPPPSRVYVKHDATGTNDGSSWANAYTDLQSALADVPDTIFVAAGTYYPTSGTDRNAYFSLADNKKVFGGFAGTEQWLTQRDVAANPTVLSGNIGDSGLSTDNTRHVIYANNLTGGARVDGFTIRDGYNESGEGAVVLVSSSGLEFANCLFTDNNAYHRAHLYGSVSGVTVENCEFKNGNGDLTILNNQGTFSLKNCYIHDNFGGGGFHNSGNATAEVINCLIVNNSAPANNGGALSNHGTLTVTNCTVANNTGYANPGLAAHQPVTVNNSIFWNNGGGSGLGGGMTVNNSIIQGGWSGGTNILNINPGFVGGGDYHLQSCSAAINAGDNALVPSGTTVDLDGNPRIFNSGTVDLGAYEFQGAAAAAARYYVDADATGANNGSSWADAFTTLEAALNNLPCPLNAEIWVAAGTYYPTATTNRDIAFMLPQGIKLYGGFAGGETQLSARNIAANPTILSGDINTPSDQSDNSVHIFMVPAYTTNVRIDGFTIQYALNGHTTGALTTAGGSSTDVVNCTFLNNTGYIGGGIGNGGTMTVDHCRFANNYGGSGGGGIFHNSITGLLTVTNSIFDNNGGGDSGGAYFCQFGGDAIFVNCLMKNNYVYNFNGAAVWTGGTSNTTLKNCTVVNNNNRSAIDIANGQGSVENCIIWDNPSGPFNGSGSVSYSLVQWGGWPGTGNISADPLFVGGGDYHIQQCSPAANTGNDAAVPMGITTDLDGNPRFFSHFSSSTVDMGAYELQNHSIIPSVYAVSGTASDCAGGINTPVMISNSQVGVNYQWKIDGANEGGPVAGTGSALVFNAPTTNGIYTATATSISGCSVDMQGFAKVYLGALTASLTPTNPFTGDTLRLDVGGRPLMSIEWQRNGNTVFREPSIFEENATTIAGGNGYGTGANQFAYPFGIGFDAAGNLYVADYSNHRVQKFAPGTTTGVTVAGGNGYGSADDQLAYPSGIWVAPDGTLYIADASNNRIQKWLPGATSGTTVAGGNGSGSDPNQLDYPEDVFVDTNGDIYVADGSNHRVQKWLPGATSGTTVAGGNGSGSGANQMNYPTAVTLHNGKLYVAEYNNHRISEWAPGATAGVTVAGGNGRGRAPNQMERPYDILFDANGDLLVCEYGYPNYRVSKWKLGAANGITVAGQLFGGSGPSQLNSPIGIALDASNALYVSDYSNHRIQKFAPKVQDFIVLDSCGTWQAVLTDMVGCTATSNSLNVLTRWYADADGDGYGNAAIFLDACPKPSGYVTDSTDCDDAQPLANPGLAEICNDGIDNNCDGVIFEVPAPAIAPSNYNGCAGENIALNPGANPYLAIEWYDAPTGGQKLAVGGTVNLAFDADTVLYAQFNPFQRVLLANIDTAKAVAFADHDNFTGDDGRGIAITPEFIFYTGDNNSVRYDHNLKNGKRLPRLDGLFSDLGTGQLYLFRNGADFSETNFDRIQPIDTAGTPIGTPILLSQPLLNFGRSNSIVFNGFGYVLFYDGNGDDFYRISLPSGQVTLIKENYDLSDHEDAETYWAWYMSEVNGNDVSLIYHKRGTNDLVRLNLTTEQKTKVATFQNLGGDAAQFVFSPWTGRLFYHNESSNAYASGSEMITAFKAGALIQCTEAPRAPVSVVVTPCTPPSSPAIRSGSVTYTSAILDWTPVATCNGNVPTDVYLSSSNTAPVVGTIPTFDNVAVDSARFFYLECGTTYYAWLRTDCGTLESNWVGPFTFNTLSVDAPLAITPPNVTVCAATSTAFTASVGIGGTVVWYNAPTGGVALDSTTVLSIAPTSTTTYYGAVTVFDSLPGNQTFSHTGAPQTFVVPQGVTRLQVTAKGASGGKPSWLDNSYLGKGGKVEATMTVTPGQTLHLYVGGAGKLQASVGSTGGYNGGGNNDDNNGGGGGGGATDIRIGGTDLANRVLVAGGGGGTSQNSTIGGQGGGLIGGDGGGGSEGGVGGSQVAGGAGGLGDYNGYPGTLGQGGDAAGIPNDSGSFPTGGGGGGYYGGGGGGTYTGSGGGGSSYTDPNPALITNVVHTQGDNIGDGTLELAWVAYKTCQSSTRTAVTVTVNPAPMGITASNISACNGQNSDCAGDDTYTADITVTYLAKPASGTLSLSGTDIVGTVPAANVSAIGATSHTFTGVVLRADGTAIELTATFSASACSLTRNAGTAPAACSVGFTDTQAPLISCPPNIIRTSDVGQCGAAVTYTAATATDNCGTPVVSLVSGLASGATFPPGTPSVIRWRATDAAGLTSECTFTVTVNDGQTPTIACPGNITRSTDTGVCTASVTYNNPTATDNCPLPSGQPVWVSGGTGSTTGSTTTTATFPKGNTTIQWRVTDVAGLTKTCSFRVIVTDMEKPTLNCPAPVMLNTAPGTCSATVIYTLPTYTDNCTPTSGTAIRTSGPASGSLVSAGTGTNVVFRATDAAGNTRTCSMQITVVDNQAPVINCPASITASGSGVPCNATVFYSNATASDNCGGTLSTFLVGGLGSGSNFPQGITTNTWRAIDTDGQSAQCSFTVTVNCAAPRMGGSSSLTLETLTDFSLRPNPASSEVVVAIAAAPSAKHLTVLDMNGRLIWEQNLPEGQQTSTILLRDWMPGVYVVSLKDGTTVMSKRLVVTRE